MIADSWRDYRYINTVASQTEDSNSLVTQGGGGGEEQDQEQKKV